MAWVDSTDDPIVCIHGTDDLIVNFNCGPGLAQPTVLNLCGMNAMKPALDNAGILNDTLIFNVGHSWAGTGHANPLFTQAVDFSTNFLYSLLPCNNSSVGITEKEDIVKLYSGKVGIFDHHGINKQIKASFGRKVNLKSGAYLIIDHTEAMHVIDVNSGNRKATDQNQEKNALDTNIEAAKEIARQLRLRDMGGIIVVDFIDQKLNGDINVTSPTGLKTLYDLSGINLAKIFWKELKA